MMEGNMKGLMLEMEEALEMGNVMQACIRLDAISKAVTSPTKLHGLFANHELKGLPTLHYLSRYRFRKADTSDLETIIKILTQDGGYDINKTIDRPCDQKKASSGFTALLASVEQKNPIFVECLLRSGARMDIRDQRGFTPCHWAIIVGDVKCLEILVQFGGSSVLESTSIEKCGELGIHPLLHTAVDLNREEMVEYLISQGSLGVNANEDAIYKVCPSSEPSKLEELDESFTPLDRAIRLRRMSIINVLLKDPLIKLSGFNQLQFCLTKGYTEIGKVLLDRFSDEELACEIIQGQSPLHCLPPIAFQCELRGKYMKDMILKYVGAGWNIDSTSNLPIIMEIMLYNKKVSVSLKCTVLHLACFYKAYQGMLQWLVDELGANINCKTDGDVELTPLQILLIQKDWKSAKFIIESGADLNVRGSFKKEEPIKFTQFMRKNSSTGVLELNSTFNSLELLIRMGTREGLPVLDQILARSDVIWHGVNEFYLAVESNDLAIILKITQHCADIISSNKSLSKSDLQFVTFVENVSMIPRQVPALIWLLRHIKENIPGDRPLALNLVRELILVIKLFVNTLDYNLNLPTASKRYNGFILDPTLFYILKIDFTTSSNILLRTALEFEKFRINVTDEVNRDPVQFLMYLWEGKPQNRIPAVNIKTIKMLVNYGLDCSSIVIGERCNFMYKLGCKEILKMLYCAGATVLEECFPEIQNGGPRETQALSAEIEAIKQWKENFDKDTHMQLEQICRLQVRKTLRCVGDVKMLDKLPLPAGLKEHILCIVLLNN